MRLARNRHARSNENPTSRGLDQPQRSTGGRQVIRHWQVHLFPLSLAFARGMNIVLALHAVILEASRRGFIEISVGSALEQRPVPGTKE
jgi:hypothetical protein